MKAFLVLLCFVEFAFALTKEQEIDFVIDYCLARHFKSVTLIHYPDYNGDEVQFFPLFEQLNANGIRFAVEKNVSLFRFSSFTLYIIRHNVSAFIELFEKVRLFFPNSNNLLLKVFSSVQK
jgi:hypothetical protein